jgi:putative transposase
MIELAHHQISIRRQCELLGLHPSTLHYQPKQDPFNERRMQLMDAQYLKTPFNGVDQIRLYLSRELPPSASR